MARRKRKHRDVYRMTRKEREILAEINEFVRICLGILDEREIGFRGIAAETGLSTQTIRNLWYNGVSRCTHNMTVWKIGKAAGYGLEIKEDGVHMTQLKIAA